MRICIGIPCYRDVAGETLSDYMRFAYYCGRRLPEHDFFLAVKTKSEQFRARNAIVESARQLSCDYMFFLDDDQVIDWEDSPGPIERYGLLAKLISHMENDPLLGIVGALYYHRGAECRPVIMKHGTDGGYYWLRDDEVINGLQEVAVTGGGCMLIRMSLFDRVQGPYFEPEFQFGTDIQICKKAVEAGFKVACDTSIKVGHVMNRREIVTPQNRHRIAQENARHHAGGDEGLVKSWLTNSTLTLYRMDVEEYLGKTFSECIEIAKRYNEHEINNAKKRNDLIGYYASRGDKQLARQLVFHHSQPMITQLEMWHSMINTQAPGYGCDFGCGSAPVTFEFVLRGHRMDFIDINGSTAYEFTKWRAKKRGVEDLCGWSWGGLYDYIFFLDSIEHLENWEEVLAEAAKRLKTNGGIITNYYLNYDNKNPEHISMDKDAVTKHLISLGIYPLSEILWVKKDLGFMDRGKEANNERYYQENRILLS